jgi:deoxyribose-phosphate aldolase
VAPVPAWLARYAHHPLGRLIDHTLLKPEATEKDIARLCEEAVRHGFAAVCVNGQWIPECVALLRGSSVRVAAVAGFPLGACGTAMKVLQTGLAVSAGAQEIDVVAALGWIRQGCWDRLREELAEVVRAADGRPVKAILETAALDLEEIVRAGQAAKAAGVAFVKTSTGSHPAGGATTEAVALLRQTVGAELGVKASGGIRTPEDALGMLVAGATRIGTSAAAGWGDALSRPISELLG